MDLSSRGDYFLKPSDLQFCFLFLRSEVIIFSLDKPLKKINLSNSPVHLPTASLCSVLFIKDPRFGLITVEGQKDWCSGQVHCETVWAFEHLFPMFVKLKVSTGTKYFKWHVQVFHWDFEATEKLFRLSGYSRKTRFICSLTTYPDFSVHILEKVCRLFIEKLSMEAEFHWEHLDYSLLMPEGEFLLLSVTACVILLRSQFTSRLHCLESIIWWKKSEAWKLVTPCTRWCSDRTSR